MSSEQSSGSFSGPLPASSSHIVDVQALASSSLNPAAHMAVSLTGPAQALPHQLPVLAAGNLTNARKPRAQPIPDHKWSPAAHLMLTPPSTPSSSLRSTSSGATNSDGSHAASFEADDGLTRFLKFSNVPQEFTIYNIRNISNNLCRAHRRRGDNASSAIDNDFLFAPSVGTIPPHENCSAELDGTDSRNDCVKDILDKYRQPHQVVFVAFYDIRDAQRVKQSLDVWKHQSGKMCSEYATPEELKKLGLNPNWDEFINQTNDSFYVSVTPTPLSSSASESLDVKQSQSQTVPSLLEPDNVRNFFAAFGDVKDLHLEQPISGKNQVFFVEFYDVRVADEAYTTLSESPTAFGGTFLKPFRREKRTEKRSAVLRPATDSPEATNCIPFPSSNSHAAEDIANNESSEPVVSHDPCSSEKATRPRCASASESSPTSTATVKKILDEYACDSPKLPSPNSSVQQQLDAYGRRPSNSLFFDAIAKSKSVAQDQTRARRPRSLSFDQGSVGEGAAVTTAGAGDPGYGSSIPSSVSPATYSSTHFPYSYGPDREAKLGRDAETYYATPHYAEPSLATPYFSPTYSFPPSGPAPPAHGQVPSSLPFPSRFATQPFDMVAPYPLDATGMFLTTQTPHHHGPHGGLQGPCYLPPPPPPPPPTGMFYTSQGLRMPLLHPQYLTAASMPQPMVSLDEGLPMPPQFVDPLLAQLNNSLFAAARSPPPLYLPEHRLQQQQQQQQQHHHLSHLQLQAPPPRRRPQLPMAPLGLGSNRIRRLTPTHERPPPPEHNQLNIARIEEGRDTRTTVMIKNIPNKMSDKDLENFIAKVCPRRIDFMYLRMDFKNGCNVGYAFVNFITVQDLVTFAKAKLSVKWNMYSSEKVLQMSYANYQGKEALVEKFKNSCIMDERAAWRPRIFYSDGPDQGLPQEFPQPTHLRRKERSTHNRGRLFPPSSGGGPGNAANALRPLHGGVGRRN